LPPSRGGCFPLGDITLRAPLDARACIENPHKVRGLRPLATERAAGARGAAGKGVKIKRAAISSHSAKVENALTWVLSTGSLIRALSRTYGCRTLFAQIFFVQPDLLLPPWPFAGRGCTWGRNQFRSSVGYTAALSEALCESNNADGYGALRHMHGGIISLD
jgi:hypothetical protein